MEYEIKNNESEHILRIKKELEQELTSIFHVHPEVIDAEIMEMIESRIFEKSKECYLSVEEKKLIKNALYNSFRRLDVLSDLIENDSISEIMINGMDNIFVEENGKIRRTQETFQSENKLRNVIQQIVSSCNRMVNESMPIVDARLFDGSRVNVVLPPVALNGPVMTIRKFPKEMFTMEKLIDMHSISEEVAEFVQKLVKARYNIFISGGTGSGKTTFLNVLANYIPKHERVITIEDSAELQIQNLPNLVRLETRNANVEGENEITMSHLIKTALRMRPTRIIVGEVRDAAAMDMANSMLTGHDGSLSTGHGNSAREMLLRLETMILMGYDMPILAIREHLAAAIDIVIHLGRLRDNSRRVLEVCEVLQVAEGEIKVNPLFEFQETFVKNGKIEGVWQKKGNLMQMQKLEQSGVLLNEGKK